MKKLFVSYEIALKLKELGFDEPCVAFYEESGRLSNGFNWLNEGGKNSNMESCTAPLYQQVIDWFREKHKLEVSADYYLSGKHYGNVTKLDYEENKQILHARVIIFSERTFNSYYEALNKAIEEAIKLI